MGDRMARARHEPVSSRPAHRRIDWTAVRASYVEGNAHDPDADPNTRTWPSLAEVATLHGLGLRTVTRRSSLDNWPAAREEFQRDVDEARRQLVVADRANKVASVDRRGLTAADAGLALVGRRLEHITRGEIARGQDAGAGVEARELAALGLAARRWVQVKDQVIGRPSPDDVPDEATQERDMRVAEAVLAAQLAEHRARRQADADADLP